MDGSFAGVFVSILLLKPGEGGFPAEETGAGRPDRLVKPGSDR
jgi:hypothetical protein